MLFDPVVFENLKVAMENQLYDMDNLDERIMIIDRKDQLNMAVMSRTWSLTFTFPHLMPNPSVKAEVVLYSSIQDLSDEILQREGAEPACTLLLKFTCPVQQPNITCPQIEQLLTSIWQRELELKQVLSATYASEMLPSDANEQWQPQCYENVIHLPFDRRINEDQMEDIEQLLEHTILTLEALDELCYSNCDN